MDKVVLAVGVFVGLALLAAFVGPFIQALNNLIDVGSDSWVTLAAFSLPVLIPLCYLAYVRYFKDKMD